MKQEKLSIFDLEEPIRDLKGIGLLIDSLGYYISNIGVCEENMAAFGLLRNMIDEKQEKLEKFFDAEVERIKNDNGKRA